MKRVLVTGATGFVGSELVKKLVEKYNVTAFVRTSSNKHMLDPLQTVLSDIEIRYGNLTDYSAVRKIIKDVAPHFLIHLGASTAVRHSYENPMEFQEVNHLATVNLVHSALDIPDFKKFLFASTMEVYGWQQPGVGFTEEVALFPESPYASSKLAAERYIVMAGKAFGLPYVISRACNTFGRKYNTGFIVEYLITSMLRGGPVYLGTPEAVRDLMYIDDHVNAYICSMESPVNNQLFNFSPGNAIVMKDLAEMIKKLTGYQGEIVHSFPPDYPARPVISPHLSLDAKKAKSILGWEAAISLEEGLRLSVDYWKQRLKNSQS